MVARSVSRAVCRGISRQRHRAGSLTWAILLGYEYQGFLLALSVRTFLVYGGKHMSPQAQRTLTCPSAESTRRSFILTATGTAACSTVAQKLAQAAIVQTDTARLPPIPLPAGIRSRYVSDINGLTFHVLEAGMEDKSRPCVLLLHGFPELAYAWRKVMLPLASAGFHVLAPDMRGYGRTTGWDDSYDGDVFMFRHTNLVRDALGLVAAFGYRSAAVVGRDAGSPVAAYCALIRPDVFR